MAFSRALVILSGCLPPCRSYVLPPDPFPENADLVRAFEDAPPRGDVPLPDALLFTLERARQEALAARRPVAWAPTFLKIAAVVALLAGGTWFFLPRPGPETRMARVTITSPGDVIAETSPVVAWTSKDRPGHRYDVWILPEEGDHLTVPALFVANDVVSPVPVTTALEAGHAYRVLVCLAGAGRTAGTPVPFYVR